MPGRRISREEVATVLRLFRAKYSLSSIAVQVGMPWNTVDRILRREGARGDQADETIEREGQDYERSYLGGKTNRCPECRHLIYGDLCRACTLRKKLQTEQFPIEPERAPDVAPLVRPVRYGRDDD